VILFSDPIFVPKAATEEEVETLRAKLESEMHRLEAEAERMMGHTGSSAVLSR
jgi:hypothetical protein